MKHILILSLLMTLSAGAAQAACFADYKAKKDNPLRLHYGVVQINGACDAGSASQEIAGRIGGAGWTLLNVISVFDESGLQERKSSAGQFFLAY